MAFLQFYEGLGVYLIFFLFPSFVSSTEFIYLNHLIFWITEANITTIEFIIRLMSFWPCEMINNWNAKIWLVEMKTALSSKWGKKQPIVLFSLCALRCVLYEGCLLKSLWASTFIGALRLYVLFRNRSCFGPERIQTDPVQCKHSLKGRNGQGHNQ